MSASGKEENMHDPIFVTVFIAFVLELLLGRWRNLVRHELPPTSTPPVYAIRPGLYPTRKPKGRYPSGFR
jgi:hypothetical protein